MKFASNGKDGFAKVHVAQPTLSLGQKPVFEVGRVLADDREVHVFRN